MMKKTAISILLIVLIILTACKSGESIVDPQLEEQGKKLGYINSIGETKVYEQKSERSFYFNFKGDGFAPREIIDGKVAFTVENATEELSEITFTFEKQFAQIVFDASLRPKRERLPDLDFSFTTFVNPGHFYVDNNTSVKYSTSEFPIEPYKTKLEGMDFTIVTNMNSTEHKKAAGLSELPAGDLAMNKEEELMFEYLAIITPVFPNRNLKIGDRWETSYNKKFETFYGATMTIEATRTFELVDFIEYKGHRCAYIKTDIEFDTRRMGEVDDFENTKYILESTGDGEGNGKIYFAFDGFIVDAKYSWYADFNFNLKNEEISADYSDVYSAKRIEEFKLIQ
ncbi:MAG: hypothetical protein ACLFSQ_10670 [Candidatus Zixiibacteriota bacterium]